jgi:signal transduction histidine kinase
MPTGGVIAIECYVNEEKEVLSLVMSDTGSGISAEDITKVFDPYFTKKNKGTGLGLMIVERIIREHGAELLVESEPGKGTKFVMNFPLRVRKTRLLEAQKNNMDNGQWK